MKLLGLIMKRPSDKMLRILKVCLWIILILTGIIAFRVQGLVLENTIFGMDLNDQAKEYLKYFIVLIWAIPLVLGWLDINILSRGRTRILQITFAIVLFIISGAFVNTATLSVDIIYVLLALIVLFAGITGKAITKKGLKHGQKITKIRV